MKTRTDMIRERSFIIVAILAATVLTGCKSALDSRKSPLLDRSWMSSYKKSPDEKIEYGQPERIAVIWSDSVASANNVANVRGFGGRIYFYDKDSKPIRANGELTVYAFDDSNDDRKTQADRVYKFRQEELQSHFSETALGPSYSVWVPWDKVGGDRKSIALMPVFKTTENQVVKSEQSINVLPGKTPVQVAKADEVYRVLGSSPAVGRLDHVGATPKNNNYGVQLASATETLDRRANSLEDRTTTISVPREMSRRLNQDLLTNSVESVSSGMEANISYGERTSSTASGPIDSLIPAASSSTANTIDLPVNPKPRSRPVFGAPGIRK